MLSFRKTFLLVALLVALTGIASAQLMNPLSCTANAGVPPLARFESLADEVGQVVIICNGGTPTPAGTAIPTVNVTIFMTAPVTSRLYTHAAPVPAGFNATEAILMVDEPGSTLPNNSGLQALCPAAGTCVVASAAGDGSALSYNPAGPAGPTGTVRVNTWQGIYTAAQPNQVTFLGVPVDPPGTVNQRVLRIANVRINARESGFAPGTFVPNDVNMFISVSGTGSLPLTNNVLRVAFVQPAMTFAVTGGTFNQCEPPTALSIPDALAGLGLGVHHMRISFTERFGTAFEPRGTATQNVPGMNYNTESMFSNGTVLPATAGWADQGTRLLVRFAGIPAGVTLRAPLTLTGTGGLALTRMTTDAAGAGAWAPATSVDITLTAGAGVLVYEVTAAGPGLIEAAHIPVTVVFPAAPALPSLSPPGAPGTVAGFLAPLSTVTRASITAPVPRFAEDAMVPAAALTVAPCQTNLLFPFIAQLGTTFDTGIAISNTSADPYGTAGQRGTCTLFFYDGTAAPPASQTSAEIVPGASLTFSMFAGNAALGVTPVRDWTGYMIARCNFQFAHGFAFISDLGMNRFSEGYLALVLDASLNLSLIHI